jgi:hypothetical protein
VPTLNPPQRAIQRPSPTVTIVDLHSSVATMTLVVVVVVVVVMVVVAMVVMAKMLV